MKILKIRDVKTPVRGTSKSAGIDFFIPNDYIGKTTILPNESILIPSGIQVNIPEGYMLTAFNKSGIASKNNLLIGACVIDEDYTQEVHINLHNVGNSIQNIEPGQKIAQFILIPISYDTIELTNNIEECYGIKLQTTERSGGFGSTGLN